jgi:energy-coupling factor transporter ATP-binding protein EcfA2
MVIGKIGSGKSSLFYSMLGEMNMTCDYVAPAPEDDIDSKKDKKSKKTDKKTSTKQSIINLNQTVLSGDQPYDTLDSQDPANKPSPLESPLIKSSPAKSGFQYEAALLPRPSLNYKGDLVFLPQKPWLFSGTIKENVVTNGKWDEARFLEVCEMAHLADDLKEMTGGKNKNVGDGGEALSGGQRSRVALAGCLYQDPDIYLLDDPLSALDTNIAEFIMNDTIVGKLKDKTRVLITHCVQHLVHADHILVMDDGKIVLEGTYEDIKGTELIQKFAELERFKSEEPTRRKSSEISMRKGSGSSLLEKKKTIQKSPCSSPGLPNKTRFGSQIMSPDQSSFNWNDETFGQAPTKTKYSNMFRDIYGADTLVKTPIDSPDIKPRPFPQIIQTIPVGTYPIKITEPTEPLEPTETP